ncbi:MAG: alkaline phosphatase, partial [bacterium]|nr:alkaline phosphatase [bacterium]
MFNRRLLVCLFLMAAPLVARTTITHGPILGKLSDEGIGVWARTNVPGSFRVIYGASPDRLDTVSAAATTELAHDNTGWVRISGLQPNTRYWYRAVTDDHTNTDGGTFRTLPRGADYRDPELNPKGLFNFRFEFACGNNQIPWQGAGHNAPAFKTMLEQLQDKIYFSIQNGDWLYEEQRMYQPDQWLKQVGAAPAQMPRVLEVAPTLAGVWENYKLFLSRGVNL